MIRITDGKNSVNPNVMHYPDGTFKITVPVLEKAPLKVVWKYENELEFVIFLYTVSNLRERSYDDISLYLPYLPNARMDRVKDKTEVFTLKYFCQMINSLKFKRVEILDAHSSVGTALLDRAENIQPDAYIMKAVQLSGISLYNDFVFFPDEGSCKRYSGISNNFRHIGFGIKKRDWNTGKILGLDIQGESPVNRDVFIIDDICAYGGTVYHSAKKLKELGCKNIYVYFTHCENSIAKGELLKGDLIKHIYTTNSLFSLDAVYNKITVIDCLTD